MPCRSSVVEVNAVIEAGTRSRFSERFSAVTMISVSPVSSAAGSAALTGAPCRIASTARVSADAPHEPALISAARPCCDRIPALISEDIGSPLLALFRRFLMKIGRHGLRNREQATPCLLQDEPWHRSLKFSACVLAPALRRYSSAINP